MLVSRQWSLKTLADHRADNRAWVRAILGDQVGDHDQAVTHDEPGSRYVFELARPDDADVPPYQFRILRAISARLRWRDELATARARSRLDSQCTPCTLNGGGAGYPSLDRSSQEHCQASPDTRPATTPPMAA